MSSEIGIPFAFPPEISQVLDPAVEEEQEAERVKIVDSLLHAEIERMKKPGHELAIVHALDDGAIQINVMNKAEVVQWMQRVAKGAEIPAGAARAIISPDGHIGPFEPLKREEVLTNYTRLQEFTVAWEGATEKPYAALAVVDRAGNIEGNPHLFRDQEAYERDFRSASSGLRVTPNQRLFVAFFDARGVTSVVPVRSGKQDIQYSIAQSESAVNTPILAASDVDGSPHHGLHRLGMGSGGGSPSLSIMKCLVAPSVLR